jgi:hypothetical protein
MFLSAPYYVATGCSWGPNKKFVSACWCRAKQGALALPPALGGLLDTRRAQHRDAASGASVLGWHPKWPETAAGPQHCLPAFQLRGHYAPPAGPLEPAFRPAFSQGVRTRLAGTAPSPPKKHHPLAAAALIFAPGGGDCTAHLRASCRHDDAGPRRVRGAFRIGWPRAKHGLLPRVQRTAVRASGGLRVAGCEMRAARWLRVALLQAGRHMQRLAVFPHPIICPPAPNCPLPLIDCPLPSPSGWMHGWIRRNKNPAAPTLGRPRMPYVPVLPFRASWTAAATSDERESGVSGRITSRASRTPSRIHNARIGFPRQSVELPTPAGS